MNVKRDAINSYTGIMSISQPGLFQQPECMSALLKILCGKKSYPILTGSRVSKINMIIDNEFPLSSFTCEVVFYGNLWFYINYLVNSQNIWQNILRIILFITYISSIFSRREYARNSQEFLKVKTMSQIPENLFIYFSWYQNIKCWKIEFFCEEKLPYTHH